MRSDARRLSGLTWVAVVALIGVASGAAARPTYFETFRTKYSIQSGDNLDACGVCHYLWTGTGARNPFGSTVEQQLYIGKSINQSLTDVEGMDPDLDGYTSLDEILAQTLPGYSCDNFQLAVNPPPDWHTFITPSVPSCLEPMDIRVTPATISVLTQVGAVDVVTVTIFNNGTDFAIDVADYEFLPGTAAAYSAVGPTPPFSISVGSSATIDIVFAPLGPVVASGTFRITSNDPDEPEIDIPLSGFGFVKTLAPADARAECRDWMDKQYRKYTKALLREWSRCYQDEVYGLACDTGRRDLKVAAAADRLRGAIGGEKDKRCAGAGLTASLVDVPLQCGGDCGGIATTNFSRFADCLVCRGDEARDDLLRDALGTAPPDLPPNMLADPAVRACQKKLLASAQKGVANVQKLLGPCETSNITAVSPVDCASELSTDMSRIGATVDSVAEKCTDTTGMLGCLFDPMPDASCVGTSVQSIGSALVDQVFDTRD
jgi:hypothetical protein